MPDTIQPIPCLQGALTDIFKDMAKVQYAPLQAHDLQDIDLREEDRTECLAGGTHDLAALLPRIEDQWSMTARDHSGAVVAVFGVVAGFANGFSFVSPWLLCSDLVSEHRPELIRKARQMVAALVKHAPPGALITNRITKDATTSREFVQALGFTIRPLEGPFDFFHHPDHV